MRLLVSTNKKNRVKSNDCTSEEEKFLRMRHSLHVEPHEPLERKSNDPEILARLLKIEQMLIKKSNNKG